LFEERNGELSFENLFRNSAIPNGHCLNQECVDFVYKNHETDALVLLQSAAAATGCLFGCGNMTELLKFTLAPSTPSRLLNEPLHSSALCVRYQQLQITPKANRQKTKERGESWGGAWNGGVDDRGAYDEDRRAYTTNRASVRMFNKRRGLE
jgi:hypothetical protein